MKWTRMLAVVCAAVLALSMTLSAAPTVLDTSRTHKTTAKADAKTRGIHRAKARHGSKGVRVAAAKTRAAKAHAKGLSSSSLRAKSGATHVRTKGRVTAVRAKSGTRHVAAKTGAKRVTAARSGATRVAAKSSRPRVAAKSGATRDSKAGAVRKDATGGGTMGW